MKKYSIIKKIKVFALLAVILISACKKPDDGVDLIINSEFCEATASFQFVNAATGEQIGVANTAQKVEVQVLGQNKSLVIDNANGTDFKTAEGMLTLGIKLGNIPSANNPYKFHVVASADGFISTSVSVTVREKGTQHFVVKMVEIANTPDGVGAIVNNSGSANASGALASGINMTTPILNTTAEKTTASMTLQAGTLLMDKDMAPVTGTITSTLVYFNNQDESSLSAFPAGFAANTSIGDIVFKTGGFVAMQMRGSGGKEVKNFGTPMLMKVEIPANTKNEDGQTISDGMVMPIWSYDPEDGSWEQESSPLISFNSGTGKYEVSFDMNHLSYWNLDWHYPGGCAIGATVNIISNLVQNKTVKMRLKYQNGGYYYYSGYQNVKNGSSFTYYNAFPNQAMTLEAYDSNYGNTVVASTTISNLCSGNYNLNYTDPNVPQNVIVDLTATCASNPGQIIHPSFTLWAVEVGTSNYLYLGQVVNGHFETSALIQGKTYQFYASYGQYWLPAPQTFTITQTNYVYNQVLPANICAQFN